MGLITAVRQSLHTAERTKEAILSAEWVYICLPVSTIVCLQIEFVVEFLSRYRSLREPILRLGEKATNVASWAHCLKACTMRRAQRGMSAKMWITRIDERSILVLYPSFL